LPYGRGTRTEGERVGRLLNARANAVVPFDEVVARCIIARGIVAPGQRAVPGHARLGRVDARCGPDVGRGYPVPGDDPAIQVKPIRIRCPRPSCLNSVAAGFTRTTVGVVRADICQPCQSRPLPT
jgi:hypothetical protein